MATVPKGKTIWIGNKRYKEGAKLPDGYELPEKKKKEYQPKQADKK